MKSGTFPWVALGLGLLVSALLLLGGATDPDGERLLPLLTLLILAELGFLVTAIGGWLGLRTLVREGLRSSMLVASLGCLALALALLLLGLSHWPGLSAA